MQKLNIKQEFPCSLEMLLRAREERYKRLDKFPELKNVEILSEERDGSTLRQTRRISLEESLPAVLTPLLSKDAQAMNEVSEFDLEKNLHTFTITPGGGMEHIFTIRGTSRYYALDDSRAAREYDLGIESKAFLVGVAVEIAIAGVYRQTLDKDQKSITGFVKMLAEESSSGESSSGESPSGESPSGETNEI